MTSIKFVVASLLTAGLLYFLHHPIATKDQNIPPLGPLLSPFTGFWQNAETAGNFDRTVYLSALQSPVEVRYDERMVPHIFAKDDLDAYYVQGYVTARHRLWQMDISTRAVSGRLSEVMGENLLERDKFQRRRGIVFAAENTLKHWETAPRDLAYLDAYIEGVNAYIESLSPADYPLEFKLLNYAPEPWSRLKAAIFIKSMALTLCSREDDIESTNALQYFGRETFDFLYPEINPKQSPIIPEGTPWDFDTLPVVNNNPVLIGAIPHRAYPKPNRFAGSNNWAVDGSKTASGHPILCNDPHLGLSLPSVWYEVQINTPNQNVYGVSFPGFPGVVIGFNESVSWGMTNVGHDVLDWYQIEWTDDTRTHYLLDGKKRPVHFKQETFLLPDGSSVIDTVRYTHWGPIVYEDENHPQNDMAMRWIAHDGGSNELRVFRALNLSNNFTDYKNALQSFHSPAQNFVFAAKDGDIALRVHGKLPLRQREQGRFIMDGSSTDNAWKGFIPSEQNPAIKNPDRGFVSSANQHSTAPDYPYYYHGNFEDYRGRVLNRLLDSLSQIRIEDMMALQNNNFSIKAEEALPPLLQFIEHNERNAKEEEMYQLVHSWNFDYQGSSAAPLLFERWFSHFYELLWDEIAIAEEEKELDLLYPESWRTIELLQKAPDHPFFDLQGTPTQETAADLAQQAFVEACTELQDWWDEGKNKNWQEYKATNVPHLGRIPAFGSDRLDIGGTGSALNAVKRSFGPSWRMIVELGDTVKAYGVYPGGQSGNPGSPYYNNMIDHWVSGKYYPLLFMDQPNSYSSKIIGKEQFLQ